MPRVLIILLLLFIAEIFVLIAFGSVIGALAVISLMFVSMVAGGFLIKLRAGALIKALNGAHPVKTLEENIALLLLPVAGFLFIFPGFISDVAAFLLLIPGVSSFLGKLLLRSLNVTYFGSSPHAGAASHEGNPRNFRHSKFDKGTVIEGSYSEVVEPQAAGSKALNTDVSNHKKA